MRKSFLLFAAIALIILGDLIIVSALQKKEAYFLENSGDMRLLVQELGLSVGDQLRVVAQLDSFHSCDV